MNRSMFVGAQILTVLMMHVSADSHADEFIDQIQVTTDVVYGHKDGMALTFDVLRPKNPNGAVILHLQSGGWYSSWTEPRNRIEANAQFLRRGCTVLIVRHGSAPRFQVPDAVADVRRCVRYVRMHAEELKIDPDRIGIWGASAGGHLTLMLATTGDDGDPAAADPVLRHSSRIAAGVAWFPPTDLRGWTTEPPEAISAIPALKPPLSFSPELEHSVSPILHVTADDAPVMIIHGDKDLLVPISHSQNILPVLEAARIPTELITVEGAAHGYSPEQMSRIVLPGMERWFTQYLKVSEADPLEK